MYTVQSNSERLPAGNSTGVAKYSPPKASCGIGNFVRRFFKFTTIKVDDNKEILNKKSLYRLLSPNVGRTRAFAAAFLGIGGSGAFSKAREREREIGEIVGTITKCKSVTASGESNRDVLLKGLKIDGDKLTEILNQLNMMLKDSLDKKQPFEFISKISTIEGLERIVADHLVPLLIEVAAAHPDSFARLFQLASEELNNKPDDAAGELGYQLATLETVIEYYKNLGKQSPPRST